MTPDNIRLGPGQLFTLTDNGPQLLGSIKDGAEITAKGKSESKEFLKVGEAVAQGFIAGVQYNSPDVSKAFTELSETCKQAADALAKAARAAINCMVAMTRGVDIAHLLKAAKVRAALNEAPPRVRHLAKHAKKARTRKKNINRALREHRRKEEAKNDKA